MNVLCVMAHPDDQLLSCGATMRRLANEGQRLFSCVLDSNVDEHYGRADVVGFKEAAQAAASTMGFEDFLWYDFQNVQFNVVPHLEMVRAVEQAILRFRPEWIFTHHSGDLHIDHRVCHDATMAALMLPQRLTTDLPPTLVKKVFVCESLSSTDWAPPTADPFRPNAFVNVSSTFDDKIQALEAFPRALKPFPHSRSTQNLKHLAYLRGAQAGVELAEAFCVIRDVYD